ncbi:MAG TPA: NYN domain-containing protein [Longimicrobiales bacterium]|nr:NYN domain-containing protein [Longimicrobiales bacterium]
MANYLYVDNSNVWIEGMHLSAVSKGLAASLTAAQDQNICDHTWRADFGRLLAFAGGGRGDIRRAVLYGSRPPPNDSLWAAAEREGFEVVVHDRSVSRREKKVDTNIATDIVGDSFELMTPGEDEFTLVAGDADYVPVVERAGTRGIPFYVVFWAHGAREL